MTVEALSEHGMGAKKGHVTVLLVRVVVGFACLLFRVVCYWSPPFRYLTMVILDKD